MQNQRMRTSYVPIMLCKKMAVTDMFRQRSLTECLVKEEVISRGQTTRHEMASHHIAQKKPKTVTSAGKVMGNLF
jgi:hypothetical protein